LIKKTIKINKAFKSKINVSPILYNIFSQFAGNRRFIYNNLLAIYKKNENNSVKKINYYSTKTDKNTGSIETKLKSVNITSKTGMQQLLTTLQDDNEFLSFSHSQSNQEASHSLSQAFSMYYDNKFPNFKEPNFKKKQNKQSLYLPNQNNIILDIGKSLTKKELKENSKKKISNIKRKNINKSIYIKPFDKFLTKYIKDNIPSYLKKKEHKLYIQTELEKLNKIRLNDIIPDEIIKNINNKDSNFKINGITVSFDKYKNTTISINYSYDKEIEQFTQKDILDVIKNNRAIGLDLGLKDKLISNTGKKFKTVIDSKKYKKLETNKRELQKKLSKKIEYNKKKILNKSDRKSITKKEYKKLVKSRKQKDNRVKDKRFPIKIDKLKVTNSGKMLYKILETDYKFSKKEWSRIYNDKQVKILQKQIYKLEQKSLNIRTNENHQISNYIVENYDVIAMEDLTLTGMQRLWGNKIKQLQLGALTQMIEYKAESQGKLFIKIDKWHPSSKTCSCCGNYKKTLKLSDRIYECDSCEAKIDRDINAGRNILREGIRLLSKETVLVKSVYSALERLTISPESVSIGDFKGNKVAA
jgi:putative transposase